MSQLRSEEAVEEERTKNTLEEEEMDEIKDIVTSIVKGCSQGGLVVPEILAAFVARTVSDTLRSVVLPHHLTGLYLIITSVVRS